MPKLVILKSPKISLVIEDNAGKQKEDWIDKVLARDEGKVWGVFVMKENGNLVRIPFDNIGAIQDVTEEDLKAAKEKAEKEVKAAGKFPGLGGGRPSIISPQFMPPGRGHRKN